MDNRPIHSGPDFRWDASGEERIRLLNGLANLPLFVHSAAETFESLVKGSEWFKVKLDTLLFREGNSVDHVYFIMDGVLRGFVSESGHEYAPRYLKGPELILDPGIHNPHATYAMSVSALTECVVAMIPAGLFHQALHDDHLFCLAVLESQSTAYQTAIRRGKRDVFQNMESRIAGTLLDWSSMFGEGTDSWRTIGFDLSYQRLANQLGCARRTVIHVMNKLQERGLVKKKDQGWHIDTRGLAGL